MNITTQTSHSKIHQLGNLAQSYEQLNHALEFYIYQNENERIALENQKHQLETAKKHLLQQPDGLPLPRPPPF